MSLTLLYRGPLVSCNYGCPYCPFAKRNESPNEHAHDARCLDRFVRWVGERGRGSVDDAVSVFFTPWGEALIHRRYQESMIALSNMPHVRRVAVQTNLSCRLDWIDRCRTDACGFWCTYHPGEVSRERFVRQCLRIREHGLRFSVGVVGLREHFTEIAAIRSELPEDTYVWVNAYKRVPDYYASTDREFLQSIDPLFAINNAHHRSAGQACRTGQTVVSVDGSGDVRRCHFVADVIGNIYDRGFDECFRPRVCPNERCGCYIGYAHLERLNLEAVYGDGLLERIPRSLTRNPNDPGRYDVGRQSLTLLAEQA